MINTTNFSVRTKTATLNLFDEILAIRKLSRSKVIETFMLGYIEEFHNETQSGLKLSGNLAKYKGIASKITAQMTEKDPRAKHAITQEN